MYLILKSINFQINETVSNQMYFTYSVEWRESSVSWASRWDFYLRMRMSHVNVKWFNTTNSFIVVTILSGMPDNMCCEKKYKYIVFLTRILVYIFRPINSDNMTVGSRYSPVLLL